MGQHEANIATRWANIVGPLAGCRLTLKSGQGPWGPSAGRVFAGGLLYSLLSEGERGCAPCLQTLGGTPCRQKTPAFYGVLLFPFFTIFWSLWLKMGQHGPSIGRKMGQQSPKMGQPSPKMGPRWANIAPRWANIALRWARIVIKTSQHSPKMGQHRPT